MPPKSKRPAKPPDAPSPIDTYLAALPPAQRAALQKLRDIIRSAAPGAEECISYQLPTFKLGRGLVSFGAWKDHCALYPMSSRLIAEMKDDLAAFKTSKGTIQFTPDKPIPAALVRKIVKARIAENAEKGPAAATFKPTKPTRKTAPERTSSPTDSAVTALLHDLDHPLKKEIDAVRKIILGVDPAITEAVKWNAPSFRTTEFFATINLRSLDGVQVILHLGAKKRAVTKQLNIPDTLGLIKWLAKDRCLVTLGCGKEIASNRKAFEDIIRTWVEYV